MSRLDSETKRKLREMGVPALVDATDIQDDTLTLGTTFCCRVMNWQVPSCAITPRSRPRCSSMSTRRRSAFG